MPAYPERLAQLHSSALKLQAGQGLSVRIVIFSLALTGWLIYLAMARHAFPFVLALAPLPVALYAGKVSAGRSKSLLQSLRLRTYYERAERRMNGEWMGEGPEGKEFSLPDHPYEQDMNIFGPDSLFQLLCTCRTEVGRRHLAQNLLRNATLEEARLCQDAIRELQPLAGLREELQLLGDYSFQELNAEAIAEWLAAPGVIAPLWHRVISLLSSVALGCLLLITLTHYFPWTYFEDWIIGLLVLNGALAIPYRDRLLQSMPGLRALGGEIGMLRQGFALLQKSKFESPLLRDLVNTMNDSNASAKIRKLERLIGIMAEKDKEWFYAISRALLIGTQVFLRTEQWKAENAEPMRRWLPAWGQFEALMSLATYAYEHPSNTFPEFSESASLFEASALGHPMLPEEECVRNHIAFGADCRLYIVSGSNMAGKSTLLRTIGLNAIMAYAGAPVCAAKLVLSRFSVCASLSIQDSLANRKSKFLAEMDKLKQALNVPLEDGPVLFLIDEILSGTNSKDRRAASEAIVRALINRGAMGALSTHDLALTELADIAELHGINVHMGSGDDADPLDFDYLVKPGVTTQSSAMAIAKLAGVF